MKRSYLLGVIYLAAVLASVTTASSQTYFSITPGYQAAISFHFDGPPILNGVVPNLFYFSAFGGPVDAVSSTTYSIYDGDVLLATATRTDPSSISGQAFRSSGNSFPGFAVGPSVEMDFAPILSGAIRGVAVFQPTFSDPATNVMIGFQFGLIRQTDFNGGSGLRVPIIDSIQVVPVPEPSSSALVITGFSCTIGILSLRFFRKQPPKA